ncbi:hypothetical protein ACHAPO_006498 [Fusarium lateritium]
MSDNSATGQRPRESEDFKPLVISTYLEGDKSDVHTQNDPNQPFERENIIERRHKVDVRCQHKDIVHGYYSDDDDFADPCSLLVFEFEFSPNAIARRIKSATVTITFSAKEKGNPDPVVKAIFPRGTFCVEPTQQTETLTRSAGINLGGGIMGTQVGGELKAETSVQRETYSAAKVKGSIDLQGRSWGDKNSVSWMLWEDPVAKAGVVTRMQAPVLLKRQDMSHFKAVVSIEIKADTMTQIGSVFKTNPKDDPVYYNPDGKATWKDHLLEYDLDNLGRQDLQPLSDVTLMTVLKGAVKEM